jgi:BlaI family penicillinase repressor
LSEAELEVLRMLWKLEAGTARQVQEGLERAGRQWAYTTVKTLLDRLEAKGAVTRDSTRMAHSFRPAVGRLELVVRGVRETVAKVGGVESPWLVRALLEEAELTNEDLEALRSLLDELERRERSGS